MNVIFCVSRSIWLNNCHKMKKKHEIAHLDKLLQPSPPPWWPYELTIKCTITTLTLPTSLTVHSAEFTKLPKYQILSSTLFTRPLLQKGSSLQEEILSVLLFVCLSVITFSFFEYSIIWWFRPCKPYIFWKLIMLATSTALFWPSNTEYQPVPPSTDQVFNDLMV